jgi:serine phosphatase RsbU (regulator of sigma subunit)
MEEIAIKIRYLGLTVNKKKYIQLYFGYLSFNIILLIAFTLFPVNPDWLSLEIAKFVARNIHIIVLANTIYTIIEGQFFWNKFTKKQLQTIERLKQELEEKNKDITDSITYAKRIQHAKLPRKEEIYTSLPRCFILFKPKDIVSGDFYFFHKNNQSIFIAAADCTGHGVPGAFMSMIGSERLEDAVSNSNDTSEILKLLNKGIKTSLRQSDSKESTRDGMDIALCSIDTLNCSVKYAGANRPIYVIRKGQTEMEEIKATKKAIGGLTEDDQHFDTHELKLQQGDTFYISTDGYADQFSGEDKKLTTKKFKQILLDIQNKTMQEQELHLDKFIENWKSGIEQIDDILVIGVRL